MGLISCCLIQHVKGESNDGEISSIISKAEQGDAEAQYNLGVMSVKGEGILQDYIKGYAWYNLTASRGHENAKKNRDIILKKMPPSQIKEGQKLFRELYDKIYNQAK